MCVLVKRGEGGTLIRRYFSRQWKRERGMRKRKSTPGKGREGVCVLGLPEEDPRGCVALGWVGEGENNQSLDPNLIRPQSPHFNHNTNPRWQPQP